MGHPITEEGILQLSGFVVVGWVPRGGKITVVNGSCPKTSLEHVTY